MSTPKVPMRAVVGTVWVAYVSVEGYPAPHGAYESEHAAVVACEAEAVDIVGFDEFVSEGYEWDDNPQPDSWTASMCKVLRSRADRTDGDRGWFLGVEKMDVMGYV